MCCMMMHVYACIILATRPICVIIHNIMCVYMIQYYKGVYIKICICVSTFVYIYIYAHWTCLHILCNTSSGYFVSSP